MIEILCPKKFSRRIFYAWTLQANTCYSAVVNINFDIIIVKHALLVKTTL